MGELTDTPHWERGSNTNVAFVFSCPGRREEAAGRPAAGQTGRNLATLIEALHQRGRTEIPRREEATVTNAWDRVEYKEKTGRTEASDAEVAQPANLERLAAEIGHIRHWIICFGNKSHHAVSLLHQAGKLQAGCRLVNIGHLSMRRLNSISVDSEGQSIHPATAPGEGARNTRRRLEVVAGQVVQAMQAAARA